MRQLTQVVGVLATKLRQAEALLPQTELTAFEQSTQLVGEIAP